MPPEVTAVVEYVTADRIGVEVYFNTPMDQTRTPYNWFTIEYNSTENEDCDDMEWLDSQSCRIWYTEVSHPPVAAVNSLTYTLSPVPAQRMRSASFVEMLSGYWDIPY